MRYYFDIRDGTVLVPDPEGIEFPDLEAVLREAVRTLGGLAKSTAFEVQKPSPQKTAVEVRDKTGPLLTVDFIVSWNVFRQ